MNEERTVEPRLLRGFRDYLTAQMNARLKIIETIRRVYERYGFLPVETPAQGYKVTLLGYGAENTKQIYSFKSPEEEEVALRFDLTVPLARLVAQYPELVMPFRRYQVAPVWRADKPDPGRFREFIQFDLDSVGTSSLAADAEILCAMEILLRGTISPQNPSVDEEFAALVECEGRRCEGRIPEGGLLVDIKDGQVVISNADFAALYWPAA